MTQVNKILSFCTKYGFVRSPKPEDSVKHYQLGPLGDLLKEKILHEWTYADDFAGENVPSFSITSSSCNDTEFQDKISLSKLLTSKKLPFIIKLKTSDRFSSFSKQPELENTDKQTVLKKYVFVSQGKSTQYFIEWQQRRIFWWKKMATFPGRFQASDVDQNENTQHLQISVNYPWGSHCVETLTLIKDMSWMNSDCNFLPELDKVFKKKAPHVLSSTIGLENAAFSVLLDAYDETSSISHRELMRFNHKMAPYQINFALLPHSKSVCEDLRDLADFLSQQLSNKGIIIKHPHLLEKLEHPQFDLNDHLGIPYTVVMQDPCLKNGIIGLRCRDTTLQEQVHVTDLTKYVLQLFKHY